MEFASTRGLLLHPLPMDRPKECCRPLHVAQPDHFLLFWLAGRSVRMPLIFGHEPCPAEWFDDACLPSRMLRHHRAVPIGRRYGVLGLDPLLPWHVLPHALDEVKPSCRPSGGTTGTWVAFIVQP